MIHRFFGAGTLFRTLRNSRRGAVRGSIAAVLCLCVSAQMRVYAAEPNAKVTLHEAQVAGKLIALEADADAVSRAPLKVVLSTEAAAEDRMADGDFYYQLREYERSAIVLHDVVSRYPKHRGYPDAVLKLGDAFYQLGNIEGARARYREVLERSAEQKFRPYVPSAMSKLLDIATRTGEFSDVERYLQQLGRVAASGAGAEFANPLKYFRGKYLYVSATPAPEVIDDDAQPVEALKFNKESLQQAQVVFDSVSQDSPYFPLAQYFSGVVLVMQKRHDEAIEVYKRIVGNKNLAKKYPKVVELSWLALGRLYYEVDQPALAEKAYLTIARGSALFSTAQYELAWAYLRLADSTKAEGALTRAAQADPRGEHVPDIGVLRGNLLLRDGRYKDARAEFQRVRAEFTPVAKALNALVEAHPSTEAYFEGLVRNNLDAFDADAFLPTLATRWVKKTMLVDHALGSVSNFQNAKRMGEDTEKLVVRIRNAIESSHPSNVFADARRRRRFVVITRNRLAHLRYHLMHIEADDFGAPKADLAALQSAREALDDTIQRLPETESALAARDTQSTSEYVERARTIEKLDKETLGMESQIAALSRYVADDRRMQALPADVVGKVRQGLSEERALLDQYRANIESIRGMIESLKSYVGVGDDRYRFDEWRRREWIQWSEKEHAARLATSHAKSAQIEPYFQRIRRAEAALDKDEERTDAVVSERVSEIKKVLNEEMKRIAAQREGLLALKETTEKLVGAIAHENFRRVRFRFNDVVLKSEVGLMDVAWSEREEHRVRVDTLSRERAREVQATDEEFREIMGETAPPKTKDESK